MQISTRQDCLNWVKDIEAEAKTRGLDTMFYIDENVRNVGNVGHVPSFVSIFTHFGKVSRTTTFVREI